MLKLHRALRERRRSRPAAPCRAPPGESGSLPGSAPPRAPLPARARSVCGGRPLAAGGAAPPSASPPSSLHARSGCRVAAAPAPRWRRRSSRRWKVTAVPLPSDPAPGSRGSRPPPSPPIPADGRCERPRAAAAGAGARPGPSVTSAPPGCRGIAVPVGSRGGPPLPSSRRSLLGPPFAPCLLGTPAARRFGRALPSLHNASPAVPCPRVLGAPHHLAVLCPLGQRCTIDTPSPGAPNHPAGTPSAPCCQHSGCSLFPRAAGPGPAAVHASLLPPACCLPLCVCRCWCTGPCSVCRALWHGLHLATQGSVLGVSLLQKSSIFFPDRIPSFPLTRCHPGLVSAS